MKEDIFYHPDDKIRFTLRESRGRLTDTYRHKGMRRKMVEVIRRKGIRDARVLAAMEQLPRHFYLDKAFEEWAYADKPFSIGSGQTISQPYTVAYQTALLDVKPGDKVLEVGTGSGYQAGILSLLGAKVYTIERHKSLYKKALALNNEIGLANIRFYFGDGFEGLPNHAPFDKILVTAGAREVPKTLLEQLKVGGVMVIPVGKDIQTMLRITRKGDTEYKTERFDNFRFVPFLKGTEEQ